MKLPWFRRRKGPGYRGPNVDSSYLLERDPSQTEILEVMYQQAAQRARQLDGYALPSTSTPPVGYLAARLYGVSPQQPEGGVSTLLHGPGLISAPVCRDCGKLYEYAGWELTRDGAEPLSILGSVTATVPPVVRHRWEHRNCPGESPERDWS